MHGVKVLAVDEDDRNRAPDSNDTTWRKVAQLVSDIIEEDVSPAPHLRGLNESQKSIQQERSLAKNKNNNGLKQEIENIWVAIGNDLDTDPTNEIQNLSSDGNNIYLSRNGGTIPLPAGPPGPKGMFLLCGCLLCMRILLFFSSRH